MKKLFQIIILSLLSTLPCTHTFASSNLTSALSLVPATNTVVIDLDWPQVVGDQDLHIMMEVDEFSALLKELGILDNQVENLTIFAQILEQKELAAVILKGSFKVKNVLDHLKESGWRRVEDKFYQKEDISEWAVPLGKGLLAYGAPEALKQVVEVKAHHQRSVKEDTAWAQLLGGLVPAPVRMGFLFPQQLQDMATFGLEVTGAFLHVIKLGPIGELITKIGMAEGIGISLSRSGQFFPTELVALMGSMKAAQLVSGALNLLKAIAGWLPEEQMDPQEAKSIESFKQMIIRRRGRLLRIKLIIPK